MREYSKKPENQSRALDSNPRASKQAPIADILQAYKNGTLGRQLVQCESVENEELPQAKTSQAPTSVILQRYKGSIQRYAPKEDYELLQGKFDTAQHKEIDEDELLQGKFESVLTSEQKSMQREDKPNNTGLPDNLKTGIENLSGYNMDDVKVHYNSDKPVQLQALAYAQGTDIHIASGQEQHLPHEAWHVVQQKQGRVQPTSQIQGVNVNDNVGLEKEADEAKHLVYQRKADRVKFSSLKESHFLNTNVMQYKPFTPEEVITLANKEFELHLNPESHEVFINMLTSINTTGLKWLFRRKPYDQIRVLLQLAKEHGDMITTKNDWTNSDVDLLLFLAKENQFDSSDMCCQHRTFTLSGIRDFLNIEQRVEMMTQLTRLFPCCGENGTKKVLESAMIYVNTSYFEGGMQKKTHADKFITSLVNMTNFITKVYEGLEEDWRDNYWIESTGSDRHLNGKHVLMLVNKDDPNDIEVFKPRMLHVDNAFVGSKGIFSLINDGMEAEYGSLLPTMNMQTFDESYGLQKYQEKKGEFTNQEALKYYYQMGMLEVASKYMGMTDLHQDNIMPTKKGPMIIDAEVGLYFPHTGLRDALTGLVNAVGGSASAVFQIESRPSTLAYQPDEDNQYHQQYVAGSQFMTIRMQQLIQNESFVQALHDKTANLRSRIVPVATNYFARWYRSSIGMDNINFRRFMTEEDNDLNEIRINYLTNALKNDFSRKDTHDRLTPYFVLNGGDIVLFDNNIIIDQLFQSFKHNDIPLFEIQKNGDDLANIFLDNFLIGTVKFTFRHQAILDCNSLN